MTSNKNSMGSEVVEGFACKPKELDPNKPIMFSAIQLFICDGHRCKECQEIDISQKIRDIVKELGLNDGKKRLKVTRTYCNGACRFRNFAYVYHNANSENFNPENSFSAWKRVHQWNDEQWKEFILATVEGKIPESLSEFRVEDKIYFKD